MKNLIRLLLAITLIVSFTACGADTDSNENPEEQEPAKFIVETDFEYHYEKEGYYSDVIMPKVADSVIKGNVINEQLSNFNTLEELQESQNWGNWSPGDSYKRYYNVSNIDGICSLNIILENLKDNGNSSNPNDYYVSFVNSYYYNENTSVVLSQSEYLEALDYTEDEILALFNKEYGEKYRNRTYDFSNIIFWFDEDNKLQFSTHYIDTMDSNTADFHFIINGEKYETASIAPSINPFGEVIKSEEIYSSEVWAGSWWIEEYYEGAYVLYSLNKETGEKRPFHVEITESNSESGFQAYTYRNVAIGSTREEVLALYPEIDQAEQLLLHDSEDVFTLEGNGGYLYLEFHFENNIVNKITAGSLID